MFLCTKTYVNIKILKNAILLVIYMEEEAVICNDDSITGENIMILYYLTNSVLKLNEWLRSYGN